MQMTDRDGRAPSCSLCSNWAPNLRGEEAREGVCRKLIENPRYYGSLVTEADDKCDEWCRLGVFEDASGRAQEDRRMTLRSRINISARMRSSGGEQSVWLADLSEHGAGISLSAPLAPGIPGVLKWGPYEVFFTVAWANDDSCGVRFDGPISQEIVLEAMREGALKNDRSAEPSRIAHGLKRVGLRAHRLALAGEYE